MGKLYEKELKELDSTYAWARDLEITPLSKAISKSDSPLVVVGSGGSYSAAHFSAQLHQSYMAEVAKAVTPLDFIHSHGLVKNQSIMILSAGGRNQDVIKALKIAISLESKNVIVVCSQPDSPLVKEANKYENVHTFSFSLPTKKDGFLATNSLLAFFVFLLRGYLISNEKSDTLPPNIFSAYKDVNNKEDFLKHIKTAASLSKEKQTILMLFGSMSSSGAIDMESKLSESALSTIQIADFRNFAHGRHNWLTQRSDSTIVVSLATAIDRGIAGKTINLIPESVSLVKEEIETGGHFAGIASIYWVLHFIGALGKAKGIDPGKPKVPEYGRNLYRLRMPIETILAKRNAKIIAHAAVKRKSGIDFSLGEQTQSCNLWHDKYEKYLAKLKKAKFQAVVFDYDGTLCAPSNRFTGIEVTVINHLIRLLRGGVKVGIATGRGKSVQADLKKTIPQEYWSNIQIGYYNGAEISLLSDNFIPGQESVINESLEQIYSEMKRHPILLKLSKTTVRKNQIMVEPNELANKAIVWEILNHLSYQLLDGRVSVLASSHSFDLLAPHVSKLSVVKAVQEVFNITETDGVLCIGDKGKWPGNDYALLNWPYSLSVDEVSSDPRSCWNIAPLGVRGTHAIIYYLDKLKVTKSGFLKFT